MQTRTSKTRPAETLERCCSPASFLLPIRWGPDCQMVESLPPSWARAEGGVILNNFFQLFIGRAKKQNARARSARGIHIERIAPAKFPQQPVKLRRQLPKFSSGRKP